jgi:chromosome segregation ATPase
MARGAHYGILRGMNDATTLDVLAECEKAAAERRALAENLLAEARDLETQLSGVRQTIAPLTAAAEAAHAAELEADERAQRAQAKVAQARSELEAERRALADARSARQRADADLAEVHTRVERLVKANGLSVEAAKRIVERRMADALRATANGTT